MQIKNYTKASRRQIKQVLRTAGGWLRARGWVSAAAGEIRSALFRAAAGPRESIRLFSVNTFPNSEADPPRPKKQKNEDEQELVVWLERRTSGRASVSQNKRTSGTAGPQQVYVCPPLIHAQLQPPSPSARALY